MVHFDNLSGFSGISGEKRIPYATHRGEESASRMPVVFFGQAPFRYTGCSEKEFLARLKFLENNMKNDFRNDPFKNSGRSD